MGKSRKRRSKDPLAPKAPLSSFMEFCKEERSKISRERGKMPLVALGQELGKRWREVSVEAKATFEEKARENRIRYEEEMNDYKLKKQSSAASCLDVAEVTEEESIAAKDDEEIPVTPSTSTDSPPNLPGFPSGIESGDIGFAKQKGYSWHPALKTGQNKTGSRIRVTYFGSGETGTVDKDKWAKYSVQLEERITTGKLKKTASFTTGLNQLKLLLLKVQSSAEVNSSGITFASQGGDRHLGRLSKDGLQKEEEENSRLMKEKIVRREGSPNKWGCRDCSWKGKFDHKAKAHAKICGLRRRENAKKPKDNAHECSKEGCNLSFPLLSQLQDHYR